MGTLALRRKLVLQQAPKLLNSSLAWLQGTRWQVSMGNEFALRKQAAPCFAAGLGPGPADDTVILLPEPDFDGGGDLAPLTGTMGDWQGGGTLAMGGGFLQGGGAMAGAKGAGGGGGGGGGGPSQGSSAQRIKKR
jgi:hypothetical protein